MRLVSIRGSMGMQEKMLCELMISVHRPTQEGRASESMHVCVGGRLSSEGRARDPQEAAEMQLFFCLFFGCHGYFRGSQTMCLMKRRTQGRMRGEIGEASSTRPRGNKSDLNTC